MDSIPYSCASRCHFHCIITTLLRLSTFVPAGNEKAGNKNDDWPEDQAAARSIAIQN